MPNEAKFIPADQRTCETTAFVGQSARASFGRGWHEKRRTESTHSVCKKKKKSSETCRGRPTKRRRVCAHTRPARTRLNYTTILSPPIYKYFARREFASTQIAAPDLPRFDESLKGTVIDQKISK